MCRPAQIPDSRSPCLRERGVIFASQNTLCSELDWQGGQWPGHIYFISMPKLGSKFTGKDSYFKGQNPWALGPRLPVFPLFVCKMGVVGLLETQRRRRVCGTLRCAEHHTGGDCIAIPVGTTAPPVTMHAAAPHICLPSYLPM